MMQQESWMVLLQLTHENSAIIKADINKTKHFTLKMLKVALFSCAIDENCYSVDWGQGICPLFPSPLQGFGNSSVPAPGEFAIQGKNMLRAEH